MFDGTVLPRECEARQFTALQGPWGIVTHLARCFEISRTLIYTTW